MKYYSFWCNKLYDMNVKDLLQWNYNNDIQLASKAAYIIPNSCNKILAASIKLISHHSQINDSHLASLQCSPRNLGQAARDVRTGGNCWACCAFSRIVRHCLHSFNPFIDNTADISRYKNRIVWNCYIYLASADMVNRCVVFICSNTPSERVRLHKFPCKWQTSPTEVGQIRPQNPCTLEFRRISFHMPRAYLWWRLCKQVEVRHGIRQGPGVEGNCNSDTLLHCYYGRQ